MASRRSGPDVAGTATGAPARVMYSLLARPMATGSGGNVALGAARALLRHAELPLEEVCRAALAITGEIDLYTNDHVTVLSTGARSAP